MTPKTDKATPKIPKRVIRCWEKPNMPPTIRCPTCCGANFSGVLPHARILNIDTSRAEKLPGVKAIVTGKDFGGWSWGWMPATRDESPLAAELPPSVLPGEEAQVAERFRAKLPPTDEILYQRVVNKETGTVTKRPILLKSQALLTGDTLTEAKVSIDQRFNEPYVSIDFDARGARLFDQITAENVKKRLAIVLDNNVYSAPVIQERISGGKAQISGSFTPDEASDLAIVLRAGALPAPVKIIQNVTVGPSLGQDSIDKGVRAAIIGAILRRPYDFALISPQ
jgi:hypothetical protein